MITKLTIENFEAEVLNCECPVLVDFYADWCGPCKMLSPTVDKMAEQYAGKLKVCKLNVDDAYPIAASFGVQSIPTLIFFKNGEAVNKSIGLIAEDELVSMINAVL
jgi:thioredoxin 1